MSIAVFRSDYVTACTASTSVRFDRKEARNRQLHIFAERYAQLYVRDKLNLYVLILSELFLYLCRRYFKKLMT
jgi:hypothetical protein